MICIETQRGHLYGHRHLDGHIYFTGTPGAARGPSASKFKIIGTRR
jgi:hypothetical protein